MSAPVDVNALIEQIKSGPCVSDDTGDGKKYWVVESDLLMDEAAILRYAKQRVLEDSRPIGDGEGQGLLAMMSKRNRTIRWRKGRVLSYSVQRESFKDREDEYRAVVEAMRVATRDWEAVCDVTFRYVPQFDRDRPQEMEPPLFDVVRNHDPRVTNVLAWSFFPDSAILLRHIQICDAFFNPMRNPYTVEGVLRHELGHILGFRHEHIREGAPVGCGKQWVKEDTSSTMGKTLYDPTSVMHYICPDMDFRNKKWEISEFDRIGARKVYGPPDLPDELMEYFD